MSGCLPPNDARLFSSATGHLAALSLSWITRQAWVVCHLSVTATMRRGASTRRPHNGPKDSDGTDDFQLSRWLGPSLVSRKLLGFQTGHVGSKTCKTPRCPRDRVVRRYLRPCYSACITPNNVIVFQKSIMHVKDKISNDGPTVVMDSRDPWPTSGDDSCSRDLSQGFYQEDLEKFWYTPDWNLTSITTTVRIWLTVGTYG